MIKNKKILIPIIVLLISVLALGGWYVLANNNGSSSETDPTINLDPPTEEEKQQAEDAKDRIVREQEQEEQSTGASSGQKTKVEPIIGYLDQSGNNVEANGYIASVVEQGGNCTLTLERQGQKVTKTKRAMPDAQSTICGLIQIGRNQLSAGRWSATITYSSAKYEGTSQPRTIEVK